MTLEEFAKTGAFGDIRIGADISIARKILGKPEALSHVQISGKKFDAAIWKYGDLEVSHYRSKISLIAVELWRKRLRFPPPIETGGLKIRARMKRTAVLRCLERCKITHKSYPASWWDTPAIKTGPGVTFVFDEHQCIDSIQFTA